MTEQEEWLHFENMCWPYPASDLEWRLRYGTPTRNDLLHCASILSAYASLIERKTIKQRNHIIAVLRSKGASNE